MIEALLLGGKDSCYNMMQCIAAGHHIVALANLRPDENQVESDELDSYMYQTVGHHAIDLYAEAMALPLYRRTIKGRSLVTGRIYTSCEGDEVEDLYELLKLVKEIMLSNHYCILMDNQLLESGSYKSILQNGGSCTKNNWQNGVNDDWQKEEMFLDGVLPTFPPILIHTLSISPLKTNRCPDKILCDKAPPKVPLILCVHMCVSPAVFRKPSLFSECPLSPLTLILKSLFGGVVYLSLLDACRVLSKVSSYLHSFWFNSSRERSSHLT
ncbi:Dph6 [Phodopus roborovskii]|uniref:Diphthine--ammonia ligase n=1 Tax=Phodopus roborovskii TaxID=109678 RepID=A0AAU9Z678_PHORO|nr:Dph6 [Phodopus roborovskii]